jgi:hypothetical protein
MCNPSSSASAAIIILWYFKLFISNSVPIPQPKAVKTSFNLGDFIISSNVVS